MLINTLEQLFSRDLQRLHNEIAAYKHEGNIWKTQEAITNSAGNLCLHLIGNLNTYIGQVIGQTGYVRNRELEFTQKNIEREELLNRIDTTTAMVIESLRKLSQADLQKEYPLIVFDVPHSTEYILIHLSTHLSYHLGQINYHRRLIDHP